MRCGLPCGSKCKGLVIHTSLYECTRAAYTHLPDDVPESVRHTVLWSTEEKRVREVARHYLLARLEWLELPLEVAQPLALLIVLEDHDHRWPFRAFLLCGRSTATVEEAKSHLQSCMLWPQSRARPRGRSSAPDPANPVDLFGLNAVATVQPNQGDASVPEAMRRTELESTQVYELLEAAREQATQDRGALPSHWQYFVRLPLNDLIDEQQRSTREWETVFAEWLDALCADSDRRRQRLMSMLADTDT